LSFGASWDYNYYQPHVTITYDGGDLNLHDVKPYTGSIVLEEEIFKEVDLNWDEKVIEK